MNRVVSLLLILLFVFSCDNEEDAMNQIDIEEPAVTSIGVPTSAAVTKEVGPGGGTITSADGKLDVTIPTGAINANTFFSIQPITDFCPGARYTYRLLPENLNFTQPVTLTFRYTDDDLEGTLTDFFGIAYQGSDGIWYRVPTTIDSNAKTIIAQATHFTDWSVLSQLAIAPHNPPVPLVEAGETYQLMLVGAEDNDPTPPATASPDPNEDDLPPLPPAAPFRARWFVNGHENGNATDGRIVIAAGTGAQYQAPATAPANNPVEISAKLTGFRAWDFVNGRRRTFNEVIVFKHIEIRDEYNYTLKIEDTLLEYLVCAIPQLSYLDIAEMDIKVKGENVTASNFSNNPPTITPSKIQSGFCTITCDPGPTGSLNVSSGSGERSQSRDAGDGYYRFNLHLKNNFNSSEAHMTLSCPDLDDIKSGAGSGDTDLYFTFILSDEDQTVNVPGFAVTLTPKE